MFVGLLVSLIFGFCSIRPQPRNRKAIAAIASTTLKNSVPTLIYWLRHFCLVLLAFVILSKARILLEDKLNLKVITVYHLVVIAKQLSAIKWKKCNSRDMLGTEIEVDRLSTWNYSAKRLLLRIQLRFMD